MEKRINGRKKMPKMMKKSGARKMKTGGAAKKMKRGGKTK